MKEYDSTPIIVGVSTVTDKCEGAIGNEPLELMATAIEKAAVDIGLRSIEEGLGCLDSLDIVNEYSWPYENPEELLCSRLGIKPSRVVYGDIGGESPLRFLYKAALRIQEGESNCSAVVGAEAAYSVLLAQKLKQAPPWRSPHPNPKLTFGRDICRAEAIKYGVTEPIHVYPFYENATQALWGQTQQQALEESGQCWEGFSRIASSNADSWLNKALTAQQITEPSEKNRLICWPYTKSMVANMFVNQGAAVILMSVAKARELDIPESNWIYIKDAAFASEPRDYLARDSFASSKAQNIVLDRLCQALPEGIDSVDCLELYSCFPVVPKMARRYLGLPEDAVLTCTGGLSFYGAPLNNYMTHATVKMVKAMRGSSEAVKNGMLYGQGEFLTKHMGVLLAKEKPQTCLAKDYDLTKSVSDSYGVVPSFVDSYQGPASLETFTVIFKSSGSVKQGVVIALAEDGRRTMARIPEDDEVTLERLMDLSLQPVNSEGYIEIDKEGFNQWRFESR